MKNGDTHDIAVFNRSFFESENQISAIGTGHLGGKATGLALMDSILRTEIGPTDFPGLEVQIPRMVVIRTDVFDAFMRQNNLYDLAYSDQADDRIALAFQKADLPFEILGDLRGLISGVKVPLAIRSSSMLEDAMYEPFAGIYGTKMTPNNQLDVDSRFRKLVEGIKFVYASTYFKAAKDYMKATRHQIQDEKMAVIIQEVVGHRYGDRYYPEISGVARSYNFYPIGHAQPDEGIVNLALGLGKTIVDGGRSWAYSPAYPRTNPPFKSMSSMLKETQTEFWSVNMGSPPEYNPIKETEYLTTGTLSDAEKDGSLKHVASTYDTAADRIWPGVGSKGPRVLTFAPILVLETIPVTSVTRKLLKTCEDRIGAAVEIEFALTSTEDPQRPFQFGFLQVRPMVVSTEEVQIEPAEMKDEALLLASDRVLGNGVINTISDVVFIDPGAFRKDATRDMANQIGTLNARLQESGTPYLLIGFGRWGTTDPTAGIPVEWGQVAGAKVIVEASLEHIYAEMSQGSHFFHNVTGFGVFYFSIPYSGAHQINWDALEQQKIIEKTNYIRHVKLDHPLEIKVDGRTGKGFIKF
jgi:hypothetical protein